MSKATFIPQPPDYTPARATDLQNQPPENWLDLCTEDLLQDAAFIIAYALPLTPASRAILAGALQGHGSRDDVPD
jgi:hypothetical protein